MKTVLSAIALSALALAGCSKQRSDGVACTIGPLATDVHIVLLADGKTAASVTAGGTISIVDLGTKKTLMSVDIKRTRCIAISPGNKMAALGDRGDGTIRILEVATGLERISFKMAPGAVTSLSFSPDARLLAGASYDSANSTKPDLRIWDLALGKEGTILTGHKQQITSVSFSPDSRTLATASRDETVKLWDARTGEQKKTLIGHLGAVLAVAFSADGKRLASGGVDLILWDLETGNEVARLDDSAALLLFSPDGKTLATCGLEVARLWDLTRYKEKSSFQLTKTANWSVHRPDWITSMAFTLDGKKLLVGIWPDGRIEEWDLKKSTKLDSKVREWDFSRPTLEQAAEKRKIRLKKERDELTARMRQEIDDVPKRIRKASDRREFNEALVPYRHHVSGNNTFVGTEKLAADPAWRDDFLRALEETVAGQDTEMAPMAAQLIVSIPGEKTGKMIVDAFKERKPYALVYTKSGLDDRLKEFSLEEKRALLPLLLETDRDGYMDTVLLKIPDPRVLPAFFAALEKLQDAPGQRRDLIARDVSIALRDLFHAYKLPTEVPVAIRDRGTITIGPLHAAELWRAWYKENGKNLVWDEQALRYTLKR